MIELTIEQRQGLAQSAENPPRAVDPDTRTTYVLVKEEDYARVKDAIGRDEPRVNESDEFLQGLSAHTMKLFGREGWDDPAMDIYDDLDPRKAV